MSFDSSAFYYYYYQQVVLLVECRPVLDLLKVLDRFPILLRAHMTPARIVGVGEKGCLAAEDLAQT